jgi:hypothetical protein
MTRKRAGAVDDHPQIPEMQDEKDDALIAAAKRYNKTYNTMRDASADLQAKEEAVKKIMHERNIQKYRYGKLLVTLENKEKLKVKTDVEDEPPPAEGEAESNGEAEE